MTGPRVLRKGRHTDTVIGLAVIVLVFAALFVCAVIGANR